MHKESIQPHPDPFRAKLYDIIFESETPAGKAFDVVLLWAIFISVFVVLIESVSSVRMHYGQWFHYIEWFFTGVFTVEYCVRLFCVKKAGRYVWSFFGVVDFLAIIPAYLGLVLVGAQSLLVIRALRLLRVFRVLKLGRYLSEFEVLLTALKASRDKILVFLMMILTLTVISGTIMYLVEGEAHGFSSIPKSIYWSIVTITTVGYGDIAPQTVIGQIIASMIMILGYAIIIVPTGIFSVELSRASKGADKKRKCSACQSVEHNPLAQYCYMCGTHLK